MTWTLHLGDCLEYLRTLPDGSVDAVVTDPPYGISVLKKKDSGFFTGPNGNSAKFWGSIHGDDKPFDPANLLSIAPKVVLFGANHYANRLPNSARWLVWDKRVGRKSNPLADCELAWTNDTRPARLFSHLWIGACRESERGQHYHPTQKPIELMKWVLDVMQIPAGATVFDPYAGSGSTGVACIQTGRNFIGCEISPEYHALATRRLKEAEQADGLFAGGGT